MTITSDERTILADALQALSDQDSRRFCDVLWIGLGDRWRDLLVRLSVAKYVSLVDPDSADGVRITDRGRTLAVSLQASIRRPS